MFEQDYIMRLIKEMIRSILKLLFNIDTEMPSTELLEKEEERATLETLLDMVDEGRINEAENRIFAMADSGIMASLESVLLFFSYLNDKSDEFLTANGFSRKELQDDLKSILSQYGLGGVTEIFMTE